MGNVTMEAECDVMVVRSPGLGPGVLGAAVVGIAPAVGVVAQEAGEAVLVAGEVELAGGEAHHHVRPVHRRAELHLPVVLPAAAQRLGAHHSCRARAEHEQSQ